MLEVYWQVAVLGDATGRVLIAHQRSLSSVYGSFPRVRMRGRPKAAATPGIQRAERELDLVFEDDRVLGP